MSTKDGEADTLRIGRWVTADDDQKPERRERPERPVVLPVAVAVAALLIVFAVVGGSMAQRRSDNPPTWVAGPVTPVSAAPASPGVSVRPAPPSPPTFQRQAGTVTRRPAATTTPRSSSASPSPSPTCTPRRGWPHRGPSCRPRLSSPPTRH